MARMVEVVWLPLLFIPLSVVSYVVVPGDQTNGAPAILNLFRNPGGSVRVSSAQTLLQERGQFHHARLAALQAQASIMSYLDIFWLLGIVALCSWPLTLFLPRMPKGAACRARGISGWR